MTAPPTQGELEDVVRRILSKAPGMTLNRIIRFSSDEMTARGPSIEISAQGWAPTFHERLRLWNVDIAEPARHPDQAPVPLVGAALVARIRKTIGDKVGAHARHAKAARTHGIRNPLGTPNPTCERYTIGHLHVSTVAIELLLRSLPPRAALDNIALRTKNLIERDSINESKLYDIIGDTALLDAQNRPVVNLMERIVPATIYVCGDVVTILETIPDTLIAALPGRPFSAIAQTGIADLDNAIIKEIRDHSETMNSLDIVLDSLPTVRIDAHPVLGPELACIKGNHGAYP